MNLIYDFIHCRAILNREIQTIERRNYFLSLNYEYCDGSCNYVYKLATSPLCLRVLTKGSCSPSKSALAVAGCGTVVLSTVARLKIARY